MPGKLIVIEGIDGSGKATQTELLVKKLQKQGKQVKTIDFPQYDNTFFGKMVGRYLRGEFGQADDVSPYFASLLFALDRFEVKEKITKWLAEGNLVICNRYATSNAGHQAGKISDVGKRKEFVQWLEKTEYDVLGIPKPDKVILLDIPPDISQHLVDKKQQRSYTSEKRDIHEKSEDHLTNTRHAFLEMAKAHSWIIIPCTAKGKLLSKEEIHEKVCDAAIHQ